MNITLTASKLTLILTPFQPAWSCARSRRVESESETTIAVTAMMTANSAVHSWAERALFRLRKFAAAGWRQFFANAEVLAPLSPTRLRSRLKPLGRPIRTYDGTCVPACQRQRTNWLHGLPAMSDLCIESAFHRSSSPKRPKMAESSLFSAGGHLPLTVSQTMRVGGRSRRFTQSLSSFRSPMFRRAPTAGTYRQTVRNIQTDSLTVRTQTKVRA